MENNRTGFAFFKSMININVCAYVKPRLFFNSGILYSFFIALPDVIISNLFNTTKNSFGLNAILFVRLYQGKKNTSMPPQPAVQ